MDNKIPNINHVKVVEHASQDFKQECTSHDIELNIRHMTFNIQHTIFNIHHMIFKYIT